jgi:hypothetical protein
VEHHVVVTPCTGDTERAGREFASHRRVETKTTHETDSSDWLAEAGAKPCNRCGKHSSIQALNFGDEKGTPAARDAVWFCFECGFEERLPR